MAFENSAGINVNNHYGPRTSGQTSGVIKTEGAKNQLSITVKAADIDVALFNAPIIPAGSLIIGAYAKVKEAFVLGGTTPTIDIGTVDSVNTNNVDLTEAQAEAVGTYDILGTPAGTWNSALVADTVVGIELGGGSPTKTAAGELEVVIEYISIVV